LRVSRFHPSLGEVQERKRGSQAQDIEHEADPRAAASAAVVQVESTRARVLPTREAERAAERALRLLWNHQQRSDARVLLVPGSTNLVPLARASFEPRTLMGAVCADAVALSASPPARGAQRLPSSESLR